MKELDLTKAVAERSLREHKGDLIKALHALTEWPCIVIVYINLLWCSTCVCAHAQKIAPPRCPRGYKTTSAILFPLFLGFLFGKGSMWRCRWVVFSRASSTPVDLRASLGAPNERLSFYMCLFSVQLAKDLLHPSPEEEKRKHKLKRLVQSPNSFFMDVKCPGGSEKGRQL